MLHLFDANVLITASNTYYPIDQIPEFWDWIDHQATGGRIKLPVEILDEVLAGSKKGRPPTGMDDRPQRRPTLEGNRQSHNRQ